LDIGIRVELVISLMPALCQKQTLTDRLGKPPELLR
jgi:hypothetical protein